MELRVPDPDKIRVFEYDFTFANATGMNTGLSITSFPALGDVVHLKEDSWVFVFDRLKEVQTVFRPVQTLLIRESERVYVDPVELRKRVKEAADAERKTRAAKG